MKKREERLINMIECAIKLRLYHLDYCRLDLNFINALNRQVNEMKLELFEMQGRVEDVEKLREDIATAEAYKAQMG